MYHFLVQCENIFLTCRVIAWVLFSFMYWLVVLSKSALCSCLVLTFPSWMLLYFMYQLLVLVEVVLYSLSIDSYFFPVCSNGLCCVGLPLFTFPAWIRLSIMYRMPVIRGIAAWVLSFMFLFLPLLLMMMMLMIPHHMHVGFPTHIFLFHVAIWYIWEILINWKMKPFCECMRMDE